MDSLLRKILMDEVKQIVLGVDSDNAKTMYPSDFERSDAFYRRYGMSPDELVNDNLIIEDICSRLEELYQEQRKKLWISVLDDVLLGNASEVPKHCQLCGCHIKNGKCENRYCVNHY